MTMPVRKSHLDRILENLSLVYLRGTRLVIKLDSSGKVISSEPVWVDKELEEW